MPLFQKNVETRGKWCYKIIRRAGDLHSLEERKFRLDRRHEITGPGGPASAMRKLNIYKALPVADKKEVFEVILRKKGIVIERITSFGQATNKGEWLRQEKGEWVALLRGGARLRFKGEKASMTMGPGDCVFIPPGKAHRVEWTSARERTVWLAVLV